MSWSTRIACIAALAATGLATAASVTAGVARPAMARCSLHAQPAHVLVAVERDTLMPLVPVPLGYNFADRVPPGPGDSLLAGTGTPMTSARVRLLASDTATRRALEAAGVTDTQPVAFIQAQPQRADCRTVRRLDTLPWVAVGDTGYTRATLAPPQAWHRGVPVFVIASARSFLYARQSRGSAAHDSALAGRSAARTPGGEMLSSPQAYFSLSILLDAEPSHAALYAWVAANREDAERVPLRWRVDEARNRADVHVVEARRRRILGTYRVTMTAGGNEVVWMFRTLDLLLSMDALRWIPETFNQMLVSTVAGYDMLGHVADSVSALPFLHGYPADGTPLRTLYLRVRDSATSPGAARDSVHAAVLDFQRRSVAPASWRMLDPFVKPVHPETKAEHERRRGPWTDADDTVLLPVELRISPTGAVGGDTVLTVGDQRLRIAIVRIDTIAVTLGRRR